MNLKRQFSHGLTPISTDESQIVKILSVSIRVNPWLMVFLCDNNFALNIVRRIL